MSKAKRLKRIMMHQEGQDLKAAELWTDAVFAEATEEGKNPTFTLACYYGGALSVNAYFYPVVIDLQGLQADSQVPVYLRHDSGQIVGHTTTVTVDTSTHTIVAEGIVSGVGAAAQEVIATSKNQFPWKSSIGVNPINREFVPEGSSAQANGKTFKGPVVIFRKSELGEISFVPRGADRRATAKVAAEHKESDMEFEQWLQANGFDLETLSDENTEALRAMYTKQQSDDPDDKKKDDPATPVKAETTDLQELRASYATDLERIGEIQNIFGGKYPELQAQAIKEGWDVEKAKYEFKLKELDFTAAPMGYSKSTTKPDAQVLQAAIRMNGDESHQIIEKSYGEKVLEAAWQLRGMGFRDVITACCMLDGTPTPSGTWRGNVSDCVQAGFSTHSLSGVLSNTASKILLDTFNAVEMKARKVMRKLSANDFKTHTGYRVAGDSQLEKVGSGGELKDGSLQESSFDFRVDTYGKYIGITRQQWINDDLGAFTEIPRHIGRASANTVEAVSWTLVIANTGNFFAIANNNYIEGAATVLGIEGLDLGVAALRKLKDARGGFIRVRAKYLVVPAALEAQANRIFAADNLIATGTGSTAKVTAGVNTHKGKYEPVPVPELDDDSIAAWYLFGDPNDVAAFGIAYLNGTEGPTVEEVEPQPQFLGKAWRGYLDFGACQMETQGGIKSKGSA